MLRKIRLCFILVMHFMNEKDPDELYFVMKEFLFLSILIYSKFKIVIYNTSLCILTNIYYFLYIKKRTALNRS